MYDAVKRCMDVAGALAVLGATWPIMCGTAIAIRVSMGGPVLFMQKRPGKGGEIFEIYKFRTMRTETHDAEGRRLSDAERMTPVGRWVRTRSLDELPQVFNILKGDMSWVGPRPLLVRYLERYSTTQMRRHEVLPGVTGWAQVCGRSSLSWEEKFEHDVWYVDHASLGLDLKILWLTFMKVVSKSDTYGAGNEEFMGSTTA